MSNKTTMILTFIASTLLPFIQELVDFIETLKNGGSTIQGLQVLVSDDVKKNNEREEKERRFQENYRKRFTDNSAEANTKEAVSPGRFLGNWRDR